MSVRSGAPHVLDVRSSGAVLRMLALMAMADGVLATEEQVMLDRLGKQYLKQSELESWDQAFPNPMDLRQVAKDIAITDRPLAAKLAYMVLSSSREDYGFAVNPAERQAFDHLAKNLELTELQKDQAIEEATRELTANPASGTFDEHLQPSIHAGYRSQPSLHRTESSGSDQL